MVTPSTMFLILDTWASSWRPVLVTWKEGKVLPGQLSGNFSTCGEILISQFPPKSDCSICVTILLFGCESWVISMAMEDKINAFGTSCYRIMLNIKRIDRVTNVSIYNLTKTTPLVERARARQLKFLGHILRLPVEEPCREYALCVPKHGKRNPGRQRTMLLKYTQCLLGDLNDMLDQRQLSAMAQDRCRLQLEKACSCLLRSQTIIMMTTYSCLYRLALCCFFGSH